MDRKGKRESQNLQLIKSDEDPLVARHIPQPFISSGLTIRFRPFFTRPECDKRTFIHQ